ncbi:response regulator transcription factor [Campylobacter geochelonis]|uniref:Transcriptional activator protein CopR n=1 Tax=Campylobacter geochelonis TaxID=1780362 RepID=A0A128EKL3_9BACT|nr:response regulator transcription factor [Campylobacter geochelonis]QKF71122.1 two-component system response regulator [Campylobacter geochelonis]CZE48932.1 transcriptional activator protein CopR [Campylobacter geochelonis]
MARILVLEDELMLNEMICDYLVSNNYECVGVKSYDEALDLAYDQNFDLWVFDVKIIGGNGFELLDSLRAASKLTPCIFTTSLNSINDLNKGFLSGCDDYLKKPFELKELLLRVQNLIKREFSHKNEKVENLDNNYTYDIATKTLKKNDKQVKLSKKESDLLALFLKNKNRLITREEIYAQIWDIGEVPSELSLRVYIRNLRIHLGERIISKPKLGYIYVV